MSSAELRACIGDYSEDSIRQWNSMMKTPGLHLPVVCWTNNAQRPLKVMLGLRN